MNITVEDFFIIWIFMSGVILLYYVRVCVIRELMRRFPTLLQQLQPVWDQALHKGILNEPPPYPVWEMGEVITIIQSIYMILHKQQLINLHKTPVHKVWTQFNECESQQM